MKSLFALCLVALSLDVFAARPPRYLELVPYVQKAPDQGETNTCWFMASTGALELLLNKKHNIKNPKPGSRFDLAESFLIWQYHYYDRENAPEHFIEEVVQRFNHQEAVHIDHWPYNAYNNDGSANMAVWNKHPDFYDLPRLSVPQVKTELLFARGKRWATGVLGPEDLETMRETLAQRQAPLIVNYNDDGYWHVVLIVGYDDNKRGKCYELGPEECTGKGAFYVRDSNGLRYEARAYEWFLEKGNAAAVVEIK